MIIYSIEICITDDIADKWLNWMLDKHIPDLLNTKLFIKYEFYKNIKSDKKNLYNIQYYMEDVNKYIEYKKTFAKKFQTEHAEKFKDKFSSQRNLYKEINHAD
tara:strand:+ start:969 stop:1277 length:309 start_codon:yes stop_codon:yes gene_type:complete